MADDDDREEGAGDEEAADGGGHENEEADDEDFRSRFKSMADRHAFQEHFLRVVSRDPARHGMTQDDVDTLRVAFEDLSQAHRTAIAATRRARDARRELRAATAHLLSSIPRGREGEMGPMLPLGLAAAPGEPLDPVTAPIARLTVEGPLCLDIALYDEEEPGLGALPEDVEACEIWIAFGDEPPESPLLFEHLDTTKDLQYTWEFEEEEAGQTVHFLVRWLGTTGEHGPWSEVVTTKVPDA